MVAGKSSRPSWQKPVEIAGYSLIFAAVVIATFAGVPGVWVVLSAGALGVAFRFLLGKALHEENTTEK